MATYIKIKIRRGSTADWENNDPVLDLGEIGADMDKHGLKVGNGFSRWSELPFCSPEIVNDLVSGGASSALSAEQGVELKTLVDSKVDTSTFNSQITNLTNIINSNAVVVEDRLDSMSPVNALSANQGRELKALIDAVNSSGGVVVVEDSLTSSSTANALSANSGRVLKGLVDAANTQITAISNQVNGLGVFGMGYTIDSRNAYDKPTKITFEDGVTATLTWTGTFLQKITASTGEVMTLNYDTNGRIQGRTITG